MFQKPGYFTFCNPGEGTWRKEMVRFYFEIIYFLPLLSSQDNALCDLFYLNLYTPDGFIPLNKIT